jgi:Fe-S-cluster containining protein
MLPVLINTIMFFVVFAIFSIYLYALFRSWLIARNFHDFKCYMCGKCCRLYLIGVKERDIRRIERHGYSRKDFLDEDGRHIRKKENGYCYFIKREGDKYRCSIHDFKPDVCREWPLVKMFRGKITRTRIFSCPGMARINRLKL